ncbi:hypothetical protein K474DRAFT_1656531 [Panus rudis PR-1116 ss-1]|nr:hypothetical protein K474DRAFT_1656531 [Panus rudis PR-1116 ss-1]
MEEHPVVLTIAGTDPSGGAGIQADLKTFTTSNCYGTSVITALTAQNTTGVQGVHPCPPDFVAQQLTSVLNDVSVQAMKTGMLFDADIVRTVARTLKTHYGSEGNIPHLVCDPVCVSTSGHTLLHPEAVDVMISELFPITSLITPNKSEAELLLSNRKLSSSEIVTLEDMLHASKNLLTLGPRAVLLKGGHLVSSLKDVDALTNANVHVIRAGLLDENMEILQSAEEDRSDLPLVVDVLHQGGEEYTLFIRPRINSTSTHGTGCTLSAAIASGLAKGETLVDAIHAATTYTHHGIETAGKIGNGYGPLNHMHPILLRAIPTPTKSVPHPFIRLLIKSCASVWKSYVEHEFVKQLAKGTLPRECFLHFIKQDYLYLRYYARAYALLAAKSTTFPAIDAATKTIINVINEVNTHKAFCAQWGITEDELLRTPESPATTAYGAYILDIGLQGDTNKLLMAVAACLLGYGEVGLWLKSESRKPNSWVVLDGNPYLKWIEDYSGEDYQSAVKTGIETLEAMAVNDPPSPSRLAQWLSVWERCTTLERGFWDMALGLL